MRQRLTFTPAGSRRTTFQDTSSRKCSFALTTAVWNGHSRRRGVECTIEGKTPVEIEDLRSTIITTARSSNRDGQRSQRGYGIEVLERFVREVAYVEFGGQPDQRSERLGEMRQLNYNDLSADRQVVAAVQGLEAILAKHAQVIRIASWR